MVLLLVSLTQHLEDACDNKAQEKLGMLGMPRRTNRATHRSAYIWPVMFVAPVAIYNGRWQIADVWK